MILARDSQDWSDLYVRARPVSHLFGHSVQFEVNLAKIFISFIAVTQAFIFSQPEVETNHHTPSWLPWSCPWSSWSLWSWPSPPPCCNPDHGWTAPPLLPPDFNIKKAKMNKVTVISDDFWKWWSSKVVENDDHQKLSKMMITRTGSPPNPQAAQPHCVRSGQSTTLTFFKFDCCWTST